MKCCSVCKKEKSMSDFPWQNKAENKVMSACKVCNRKRYRDKRIKNPDAQRKADKLAYQRNKKHRVEYARKYRRERPDKTRVTNLKVKYGISVDQYDLMFKEQNGKCKICGTHQEQLSRILCVDHCHTTGKIRGLLCDTCNKFLGFYEVLHKECCKYLSGS